jgi:mono/diheme cytochrome c family protein
VHTNGRYDILRGFLSGAIMRHFRTIFPVILISFILLFVSLSPTWAAGDPAILFQNKCAVCHGVDGLSNTPLGKKQTIPSFASDKVQKAPPADLTDFILNGGREKKASHSFASKGISQEDAAQLAVYIKVLGKKR